MTGQHQKFDNFCNILITDTEVVLFCQMLILMLCKIDFLTNLFAQNKVDSRCAKI